MLVVNDRSQLGDKQLSVEELVCDLKERTQPLIDKRKMFGQKELENHERSAGPRMSCGEILSKLKSIRSDIRVLDGLPGNVALYVERKAYEMDETKSDKGPFFDDHKYVGGFPTEPLPEYSHITIDEKGLPKREVRGWRSVLMTLIKSNVISYSDAVETFGEATGPRSDRWHQELRSHK